MARYRGGDGRYADMECAYAELERYLVLSCKVVAHEGREVCRSPRSEGSLSAFCSERDGDYADRVFAFADLVLSALLKQQSRRRYATDGTHLS